MPLYNNQHHQVQTNGAENQEGDRGSLHVQCDGSQSHNVLQHRAPDLQRRQSTPTQVKRPG